MQTHIRRHTLQYVRHSPTSKGYNQMSTASCGTKLIAHGVHTSCNRRRRLHNHNKEYHSVTSPSPSSSSSWVHPLSTQTTPHRDENIQIHKHFVQQNDKDSSSVKLLESGRKWWLVPSVMAHLGRPTKTILFRETLFPPQLQFRQQQDGTLSLAVTVRDWMPQSMNDENDLARQHRVQEGMPTDLTNGANALQLQGLPLPQVEEVHCTRDIFSHTPYFKMSNFNYEVVRLAFAKAGFKRIEEDDYLAFWGRHLPIPRYAELNPFQRVNHFPGSTQLGRKDYLHINLHRMLKKYGSKEIDFFPNCYLLPYDNEHFSAEIARDPNKLFITKPFASSCGRGISVVRASDPSLFDRPNLVQVFYIFSDSSIVVWKHQFHAPYVCSDSPVLFTRSLSMTIRNTLLIHC